MTEITSTTLNYYNQNADSFTQGTVSVDFSQVQDKFLERLNEGDCILDFGCGSGRDTKYFLKKGIVVDAIDGSVNLCKLASEYTGIKVQNILFQELDEQEKYDGIWACASILHLPKEELSVVLDKMIAALKKNGIIYTSFKYGDFEGERNSLYFIDFTVESFKEFIENVADVEIVEYWITGDVRQGRGEERWLNIILQKH